MLAYVGEMLKASILVNYALGGTEMLKASITLANVVNGGPSEASLHVLVTYAFPSEASLPAYVC